MRRRVPYNLCQPTELADLSQSATATTTTPPASFPPDSKATAASTSRQVAPTARKGSINLYNLRRRNVSFGNPAFRRILIRLNLTYKNEGNNHCIYRAVPTDIWFEGNRLLKKEHSPQLLYSGTNAMVDWLVGEKTSQQTLPIPIDRIGDLIGRLLLLWTARVLARSFGPFQATVLGLLP